MTSPPATASPLRAIQDIRREELPQSLLMFLYFLLVITSFWILKPIKKTVFIAYYDVSGFSVGSWHMSAADAELLAKLLNMLVAYTAVVVFAALSDRFVRQQLTTIFGVFFIVGYAAFSFVLDEPADWAVWCFYLFGDLFSTLMVATFFAFLNDIVSPDQAKRTYGLVGLGGVTGGVLGTTVVKGWIGDLDRSSWMWVCTLLAVIIIVIGQLVGRLATVRRTVERQSQEHVPSDEPSARNPALDGAKLVFRSPYLVSIVGIVAIYEMVSTIMDYQFSATVSHFLDGPAIGEHFATIFTITNATAFVVQLFFTSYVMTRFGVKVALLVLPAAAFLGSVAFVALPILWIGSLLNTADNAFSYSINQSAKESLYVPTTKMEKYKAKAFIDMFVQRFAKGLAVVSSLGITAVAQDFSGVRWLSMLTAVLLLAWMAIARYAGRRFEALTESYPEAPGDAPSPKQVP